MKDNLIQKGLEQDARKIKERILMGDKWLKAKDAADKLAVFLKEEKGWTQTAVAKAIGASPAVISQFLKCSYKGDTDDITNKVINFINTQAHRKAKDTGAKYVSTTIAKAIHTLIVQTDACSRDEGKIAAIVGDGGHGKSLCLKEFTRANRNSIYVELDDTMTPTTMFNAIAGELGLYDNGTLSSTAKRLIEHLRNRQMIIILDEASGLKVKQLNQLRQVIAVKCKCPLILAGNADLAKTILQRTTKHGYESLDQFTSRMMYILNLDELASSNDGGLYTSDDIKKLYEYGGVRLTADGIKMLRTICKTPRTGRLRICSHIISVLHTAKEAIKAGLITKDLIETVINQLKLPVRDRLPVRLPQLDDDEKQEAAAKTG